MRNMNDKIEITDKYKRNQTLIVVEGKFEKNIIMMMLGICFPEMSLEMSNIHIYGAKIYDLYHMIELEYGRDWFEQELEINIPYLISKKFKLYPHLDRRNFTNIILIFDYERHDILYSYDKILKMQKHFSNVSEDGILYINYPMIESFVHMDKIPDDFYIDRKVSVKCRPGKVYKNIAKQNSVVNKYFYAYKKIIGYLKEYIDESAIHKGVFDIFKCADKSNINLYLEDCLKEMNINETYRHELSLKISSQLIKLGYLDENISFLEKLRSMMVYVALCNIKKAWTIQEKIKSNECSKECYEKINWKKILKEQNMLSKDEENGYIWVLCSCITFLGEFKFLWNN